MHASKTQAEAGACVPSPLAQQPVPLLDAELQGLFLNPIEEWRPRASSDFPHLANELLKMVGVLHPFVLRLINFCYGDRGVGEMMPKSPLLLPRDDQLHSTLDGSLAGWYKFYMPEEAWLKVLEANLYRSDLRVLRSEEDRLKDLMRRLGSSDPLAIKAYYPSDPSSDSSSQQFRGPRTSLANFLRPRAVLVPSSCPGLLVRAKMRLRFRLCLGQVLTSSKLSWVYGRVLLSSPHRERLDSLFLKVLQDLQVSFENYLRIREEAIEIFCERYATDPTVSYSLSSALELECGGYEDVEQNLFWGCRSLHDDMPTEISGPYTKQLRAMHREWLRHISRQSLQLVSLAMQVGLSAEVEDRQLQGLARGLEFAGRQDGAFEHGGSSSKQVSARGSKPHYDDVECLLDLRALYTGGLVQAESAQQLAERLGKSRQKKFNTKYYRPRIEELGKYYGRRPEGGACINRIIIEQCLLALDIGGLTRTHLQGRNWWFLPSCDKTVDSYPLDAWLTVVRAMRAAIGRLKAENPAGLETLSWDCLHRTRTLLLEQKAWADDFNDSDERWKQDTSSKYALAGALAFMLDSVIAYLPDPLRTAYPDPLPREMGFYEMRPE